MVLSNIGLYGDGDSDFSSFQGVIHEGLSLNSNKKDVIRLFGLPNDPKYTSNGHLLPGEDDWVMSWDKKNYCLFVTFTDDEKIVNVATELPLDQT